ncbi:MAG: peptidoglycan DD-metalloendopeptidase family protein [bacterium]
MSLYHASEQLKRQRPRRRLAKASVITLLILTAPCILLLGYLVSTLTRARQTLPPADTTMVYPDANVSLIQAASSPETSGIVIEGPPPPPSYSQLYRDGTIKDGESIYQCLHREGIADRTIHLITSKLNPLLCFRSQSRPGDIYRLSLTEQGEVERFEYQKSPLEIYCLSKDQGNNWNAWREDIKIAKYWVGISGEIKGSLFTTMQDAGYPVSLALQFAEILEWKIDFQHEVREGDRFRMVFERYFRGDEPIGYGRILAIQYEGQVAGTLKGFYFRDEDRGGYYDPEGVSLRQAFLRAPLSYKYISSGYSHHRRHPILGSVRPHLGIDFAAPYGSPVWAVADGVVLSTSYDKYNGNQIKLRHMNAYITYYNHLSGFARGLKKGVRVVQKQVIGYVGTTGLSTGPHLDYRVKKGARFINPLKEQYPSGKPLKRNMLPQLRAVMADLGPLLQGQEDTTRVLVAEMSASEVGHPTL